MTTEMLNKASNDSVHSHRYYNLRVLVSVIILYLFEKQTLLASGTKSLKHLRTYYFEFIFRWVYKKLYSHHSTYTAFVTSNYYWTYAINILIKLWVP